MFCIIAIVTVVLLVRILSPTPNTTTTTTTMTITTTKTDCPLNMTGGNCDIPVICNDTSCAANALCSVGVHNITCKCGQGFVGDPYIDGCTKVNESTSNQVGAQYATLDGMYIYYEGTCPYVLSEPCNAADFPLPEYHIHATNVYDDDT